MKQQLNKKICSNIFSISILQKIRKRRKKNDEASRTWTSFFTSSSSFFHLQYHFFTHKNLLAFFYTHICEVIAYSQFASVVVVTSRSWKERRNPIKTVFMAKSRGWEGAKGDEVLRDGKHKAKSEWKKKTEK